MGNFYVACVFGGLFSGLVLKPVGVTFLGMSWGF